MHFSCIGLDYNSADVELRGRVAFTESKYNEVYKKIMDLPGISGCVIISTCNRTELYINGNGGSKADVIMDFVEQYFKLSSMQVSSFFKLDNHKAVQHIFRVASGIESMVLGEDQILNQVKEAQKRAMENNAVDSALNKVFREAITCAKEVKHKTSISQNKLSIASIAVDIIQKQLKELESKSALIVGVGEMSILTIKGLYDKGIRKIYLANRTKDKSRLMLDEYPELELISFENRYELLGEVDIVVSSTAAPHTVFNLDQFKAVYKDRSLLLIDMAVPRDIEESIKTLNNITYYDIDHFKDIAEENTILRKQLTVEAEDIIEQYIEELNEWLEDRDIHSLLSKIDSFIDNEAAYQAEAIMYKLDCGDYMNKMESKEFALSLSNKLLKKLALKVKKVPRDKADQYIYMLNELLD